MAELIFYSQMASLDKARHGKLKLRPVTDFGFSSKTNSVPVIGAEFSEVAKEYPIVFVKGADGVYLPVALLGLRDGENLVVVADGRWDARYIPSFVRRYPFAPADVGDGQMVVCLDEAANCFSETEGDAILGDDDTQQSPLLQRIIAVLQGYQGQAMRTTEFCKRLADADLLTESSTQAQLPDGSTFNMGGIYVVDEERLQDLPQEKVQEFFSLGELGLIYAHLISMSNIQRLFERLSGKLAQK